jgi:hypothetical protein
MTPVSDDFAVTKTPVNPYISWRSPSRSFFSTVCKKPNCPLPTRFGYGFCCSRGILVQWGNFPPYSTTGSESSREERGGKLATGEEL